MVILCWVIWRCQNDIIFNKTNYHDNTTKKLLRQMISDIEVIALQITNLG
jgi:hypothetical protein